MADTITKKLMLFFPKCECEKPIICHLVRDYDLTVNVFRAKVTPDEEGYLVLDVMGTEKQIEEAMDFVRTFNVTINDAAKGLIWDADVCTHCGQCVPHCPTDALHIADRATREVAFEAEECVECQACIPACPYGACTSAF
ncbi:4Fe-4S binding protein [Verrucomicrobiota bacterium]